MQPRLTPSSEAFLLDWAIILAMGGTLCVFLGFLSGWIIWRNSRRMAVSVEAKNRLALSDYEKTSDEISRIKSELAVGGQ